MLSNEGKKAFPDAGFEAIRPCHSNFAQAGNRRYGPLGDHIRYGGVDPRCGAFFGCFRGRDGCCSDGLPPMVKCGAHGNDEQFVCLFGDEVWKYVFQRAMDQPAQLLAGNHLDNVRFVQNLYDMAITTSFRNHIRCEREGERMIIGLTGGIASGKSTVAKMMADLGAKIIDADQVARQVVEPGEPTLHKIVDRFGEEILHADGTLDRKKLGNIVFRDQTARMDLNQIIHPAIRTQMKKQLDDALQSGEKCIVMDIPLLFESERSKREYPLDKILVVYVPEPIQIKRLMDRDGIDETLARQKINSQIPMEEKKDMGDAYIDNSGTLESTKKQLLSILKQWREEVKR